MRNRCLVILLCLLLYSLSNSYVKAQNLCNSEFVSIICYTPAKVQKTTGKIKIYHDPDADFKQRRGQIHNRTYLKNKLASLHLNIDSLQDRVDHLNRDTRDKEWEYQISTIKGSAGKILPFYKSHKNPDGSTGRTIYGEERRRMPER